MTWHTRQAHCDEAAHINTDQLISRLGRVVPEAALVMSLPLIRTIEAIKAESDAVIVAHNYQTPLMAAGVADFLRDSLAMARSLGVPRLIMLPDHHWRGMSPVRLDSS